VSEVASAWAEPAAALCVAAGCSCDVQPERRDRGCSRRACRGLQSLLRDRRERSSTQSMRSGIAAPIIFTTGGIGATQGDITADRGEGVRCADRRRSARSPSCHKWVKTTSAEMNEARLRMQLGEIAKVNHAGARGAIRCSVRSMRPITNIVLLRNVACKTRGRGPAGAGCGKYNQVNLALSRRKQGFESPRERQPDRQIFIISMF
jgi:hypothetical protein